MPKANRGGWKTCSRGHKYRGPGACPICYPGATKKRVPAQGRGGAWGCSRRGQGLATSPTAREHACSVIACVGVSRNERLGRPATRAQRSTTIPRSVARRRARSPMDLYGLRMLRIRSYLTRSQPYSGVRWLSGIGERYEMDPSGGDRPRGGPLAIIAARAGPARLAPAISAAIFYRGVGARFSPRPFADCRQSGGCLANNTPRRHGKVSLRPNRDRSCLS
jgi:hypothetical protein